MTILRFYAFIVLPALLVVGSYVAVVMYERTSRSNSGAPKKARDPDAKSVVELDDRRYLDLTRPEKPATASRLRAHPTTDWK
jgi:hypothetical protein